jgi:preprotein translocase subunit SecG
MLSKLMSVLIVILLIILIVLNCLHNNNENQIYIAKSTHKNIDNEDLDINDILNLTEVNEKHKKSKKHHNKDLYNNKSRLLPNDEVLPKNELFDKAYRDYYRKKNRNIIKDYDYKILKDPFKSPADRPENAVIRDLDLYNFFNISTHGPLNDFRVLGTLIEIKDNNFNLHNIKKINDMPLTTMKPVNEHQPQKPEPDKPNYQEIEVRINNNNDSILQLFGREKYRGAHVFQYYTMTPYSNVKIPLAKRHNKELYDGDIVFIKEFGKSYRVSLYPREEPEYIPENYDPFV